MNWIDNGILNICIAGIAYAWSLNVQISEETTRIAYIYNEEWELGESKTYRT